MTSYSQSGLALLMVLLSSNLNPTGAANLFNRGATHMMNAKNNMINNMTNAKTKINFDEDDQDQPNDAMSNNMNLDYDLLMRGGQTQTQTTRLSPTGSSKVLASTANPVVKTKVATSVAGTGVGTGGMPVKTKKKRKKRTVPADVNLASAAAAAAAAKRAVGSVSPPPIKRRPAVPTLTSNAVPSSSISAPKAAPKPQPKKPDVVVTPKEVTPPSSSRSSATDETEKNAPKIPASVVSAAAAASVAVPQMMKDEPPKSMKSTVLPSASSSGSSLKSQDEQKMPSIFTQESEVQYDTYAACLAATESLRRMRDSKLSKKNRGRASSAVAGGVADDKSWKSLLRVGASMNNRSGETGTAGSATGIDRSSDQAIGKEEYKRACAEYVLNSSKAIKALGLSVSQFNQLGREVSKNSDLKEKVMEQAYLYRMASTIKMDKIPLIQDPDSKQLLKSTRRRRVQMFVKSITEIEELREEQTSRLRRALKIDKLPSDLNLCDPNVLPLLSPKVRTVIEAFPLQAEEIVKKYGLNSDEFNQMLEETRGNPVFRW
eukprot:CAMPEP_0194085736 /NCGR_PEP_ID=MMETSP0149-20130528/18599_1 /TAXON_ID=122233 /ORGANISM="Chaetoceros debilis, Strain MM31A-1" /LENGTH=544 /DNA_ID=CAMNT_0038768689 /DNA_START=189 /DNA_END=1820 /DNA_ORIENTATION=+